MKIPKKVKMFMADVAGACVFMAIGYLYIVGMFSLWG